MSVFLELVFIFYIGSTIGWFIELLFRRIVHGKWVNPGFLVGPYLPIYGFGLLGITMLHMYLEPFNFSPFVYILIMGLMMSALELVVGLFFLKIGKVRLWDYSKEWMNYKGVICPLFSLIWTFVGAIYYFFLANALVNALEWFSVNLSFSFILGIFFGLLIMDVIYSTKVLVKIRKFAKNNDIKVKYEEFKEHIHDIQKEMGEKYSFLFAFKQNKPFHDYLTDYLNKKTLK
jgi:uncharacterized membrane protein